MAVQMPMIAEHAHAGNIAGVQNRKTVFRILYKLFITLL
jgi:hypothetical protein